MIVRDKTASLPLPSAPPTGTVQTARPVLVACVVAWASLTSIVVHSEPAVSQSYIEELTVVGERDKETLRDESHSVAVFTREDLRVATQHTFGELFERVPNATTNERNEPVIRGIPQFGVDNGLRASATTTTFYRDGLGALTTPVLWDALTAEVSRGPQNELRPSIGGVLAIGTRDPGDSYNGRARVTYTPEGNDREFGFAVGGPLSGDLSGRLAGYRRSDDGHTTNVTRADDTWDRYEETLGRIKLLWRPASSPGTSVRLLAEYIERDSGGGTEVRGDGNDPQFDPFDRLVYTDADAGSNEKSPAAIVDVTHDFGGRWLMNVAAGWTRREFVSASDGDGTALPVASFASSSDLEALGMVLIAYYRGDEWQVRLRQRLTRLNSDYVEHNVGALDPDGPGPLPPLVTDTQVEVPWPEFYSWTSQISAARNFGTLRFAGSLAYEGDTTGSDFSITTTHQEVGIPPIDAAYAGLVNAAFPQVVGQTETRSADLLPMLSLSWSADDRTIYGIKWEQARRAGGVTVNIARKTLDTYDPEHADNFDLFARATRFDDRLSIAASLFHSRITDLQMNAVLTNAPSDSQLVNAQRAHTQGLEVELAWTEASWNAFLTIGLLDAQLDDASFGLTDLSDNRYPYAPRWSLSLGANYDTGRGFFAAFDLSTQPEAPGTFDNRPGAVSEGRTLVNARLGWRWQNTSVSLDARNLTDDKYHTYRDLGLPTYQSQVFFPGDPRVVGITLEVDW